MQTKTSYSGLQIALHWAIALLIGANYLISEGMGRFLHKHLDGEVVTGLTPNFHVYVGVAVMVPVSYTHLDVYKRQFRGLACDDETDFWRTSVSSGL